MSRELQTGVHLACATFLSGFAWQPICNLLDAAPFAQAPSASTHPPTFYLRSVCHHTQAAAGVGAGCGLAFFAGLRGGRVALSGLLPAVEPPSLDNLKADAALSLSIGGATGTFVGVVPDFSDNPFLGPSHLQRPSLSESARRASTRRARTGTPIAILGTASTASGCASSAQATCLGFAATQTLQNVTFPRGANWIDGCVVDGTYKTG